MKLRRLESSDVVPMLEWMTADDVEKFFRFDKSKITIDTCKEFIKNSFSEKNRHYAIADDDNRYLGTISLKNINVKDSNAELAIALANNARGLGYGTLAVNELLKIAFDEIGLHKVYLNVLSDNAPAIHLYEKSGFVFEGELIDHVRINGKYQSLKLYGIINHASKNY